MVRPAANLLRALIQGGRPTGPMVEQRFGLGDFHIGKEVIVAMGVLPQIVRSFVVKHVEEGLLWIADALEPVQSLSGNDIGAVPAFVGGLLSLADNARRMLIAHFDECRVMVLSLSRQDSPVVESDRVSV